MFSEVIVPYVFSVTEFQQFPKIKSDLISETSTAKYLYTPNFSQINEGVWEL